MKRKDLSIAGKLSQILTVFFWQMTSWKKKKSTAEVNRKFNSMTYTELSGKICINIYISNWKFQREHILSFCLWEVYLLAEVTGKHHSLWFKGNSTVIYNIPKLNNVKIICAEYLYAELPDQSQSPWEKKTKTNLFCLSTTSLTPKRGTSSMLQLG
jgi:hypothetical protein